MLGAAMIAFFSDMLANAVFQVFLILILGIVHKISNYFFCCYNQDNQECYRNWICF